MSATRHGSKKREAFDDYPSYRWCVDRLLEAIELPGGLWLEPCAGAGIIIEAVNARRNDVSWVAVEIHPKYEEPLRKLITTSQNVAIDDFLKVDIKPREYPPLFSVACTNPPFDEAQAFIEKTRKLAGITAMLLRLSFLETEERQPWLVQWYPDVYILPNRPNFRPTLTEKKGKPALTSGDSAAYAWLVWDWRRIGPRGTVQTLALTPQEVRLAELKPRQEAARATAALQAPRTDATTTPPAGEGAPAT